MVFDVCTGFKSANCFVNGNIGKSYSDLDS